MFARRMLFGLMAVSLAFACAAAEMKIRTDGGQTFTFRSWGADWVIGDPIKDLPPGAVSIHGADATKTKKQVRLQGGDYAEGFTGALSVGGQPYVFEVLWNKGGEAAGNSALTALKGLSIQ